MTMAIMHTARQTLGYLTVAGSLDRSIQLGGLGIAKASFWGLQARAWRTSTMKKTWEVVRQDALVIPLGYAPKPGKVPPWRIISDARDLEVNEGVKPWKF